MNAPSSYDAIVVGGGINGLVAAAYLAKARKKVLLLEGKDLLGGRSVRMDLSERFETGFAAPTLYALDPLVAGELKLSRFGFRLTGRELSLVGPRGGMSQIVLSRNVHDTAAALRSHSNADAAAWPRFRAKLFEMARAMRPLWWEAQGSLPDGSIGREIEEVRRMGASAWLDTWFESDALKAALGFDATVDGMSIAEPGSAMALLWRAAQEVSGLQGATMVPMGGLASLAEALAAAAQASGAELRTGAAVQAVVLHEDRMAGVRLHTGETCFAPVVLSALSARRTIRDLLPPGVLGFSEAVSRERSASLAEAVALVVLVNPPAIEGAPLTSRFITAE
jgi:phytoene dehydrogenase-like protein